MGKKVKRRAACNAHKEKEREKGKQVFTSSPKAVSQEDNQSSVTPYEGSVLQKERRVCVHLEKSIDLGNVSSKIESAESTGCEDCREGVNDRKAGKGKGKLGKKKGASDSRANKATWICLQCGHFSCGGVGLPTSPQSHALRHSRQNKHPLVIQLENPLLRWCFTCSTLLPVDKLEDTGEHKDVFLDIVKLLKKQSSKVRSVDVEDIWFGSGSVVSEVKAESKAINLVNGKDFYAVRGLVNLGNTCFFNSVMQNLLAMDILRECLLNFEGSMGPLTSALKKFFVETSPESGLRNVINPRSLFECVCAKASQFRGYQQQDSHELLRCLLDGLSSEDLYAKKSASSSPGNGKSLPVSSTFVDAIFGGQTSSTICCVECGHSSVVYEPFLDLSLSVPTKRPLSKKVQPVHRAKKTKLSPKRGGRICPKLTKNEDMRPSPSNCISSTSIESSSGLKDDLGPASSGCNTSTSTESSSGLFAEAPSCAPSADFVGPSNVVPRNALVTQDSNSIEPDDATAQVPQSAAQDADGMSGLAYLEPISQSVDAQGAGCFSWMDYLKPISLLDDPNSFVKEGFSVAQDLGSHDGNHDTVSTHDTAKSIVEASLSRDSAMEGDNHGDLTVADTAKSGGEVSEQPEYVNLKAESTVDDWDEERPVQVQDNEILLLTYKEDGPMDGEEMKVDTEFSSSAVVDGEDSLGFDGLGDLFNEPEAVEAGVNNTPVSDCLGNGFLAGNSTESDPDEVDDTDSPVSVESCLAHFIKPEVLSGEHAWHCENCSKLIKEGRKRMRKNQQKTASIQRNKSSDVCSTSEILQAMSHSFPDSSAVSLVTLDNGSSDTDENLKKHDTSRTNELCQHLPQEEEIRCVPEAAHLNASGPAVCSSDETFLDGKSGDTHGVFDNHVPVERLSGLSEEHESGEDEEEEVDLKCVKVMRDATKRILISKTPPILTIHLNRFLQDARGRLSKLNGHVGFKEYIDLGPYMDCRSAERDNCIYHLIGVVEHSGSMRGGHYVAYVKGGDRRRGRSEEENRRGHSVWYHTSDAYVCETTLEEVLSSEAYILFYEKAKL